MTISNVYFITKNKETIKSLTINQQKTEDIFIMRNAAQQRALMLFQMNNMDDFFERDDLYILFKKEALKFTLAFKHLREIDAGESERKWEEIQSLATLGSRTQNEAADLIYVEEKKKAQEQLTNKVIPVQKKVISGLKKERDRQQALLKNQIMYIEDLNIYAYWFVVSVGIISVIFGFAIAVFVSRHNLRASKLEIEKKMAEEENIAKSEFIANMSHELRTPIHAIISFSEFGLKKKSSPAEKLQKFFGNINDSGKRLIRLVDNLLDIAKFESGKFKFEFKPTNIKKIVEDNVTAVSSLLENKKIDVNVNTPDNLPEIICDPNLIGQVCTNLLSNAIKFSNEGGAININLELIKDKTHTLKENMRFSIEDTGVGIPKEELKSVFDKFIQSSTTNNGSGGTGLGLAICSEIIASHSGKIWAESGEQSGARFVFDIPTSQAA